MIRDSILIARKDLTILLARSSAGFIQSLLLGLLLIFLFSLSLKVGEKMTPQAASAIFWMATCFCQVLVFNSLYGLEETNEQRAALLIAPILPQAVWLGKACAAFILIFFAQMIFFPAIIVFLGQEVSQYWYYGLGILLLANYGSVFLGSLLGALSQGQSGKDSLFSIILFPLLIPILLAGIQVGQVVFSTDLPLDIWAWFGTACAFDAIFAAAGLVLFPFIFSAEN